MPKQIQAKPKKRTAAETAPPVGKIRKQRSAVVTLTIGAETFKGKSSGQFGHAEMEALRKFVIWCDKSGQDAPTVIAAADPKQVKCPNQPICVACSTVLKHFEFKATSKPFSKKKSGGVAWGVSMKVAQFMKDCRAKSVLDKALRLGAK